MKKDRNCGGMPIYPNMMPYGPVMGGVMTPIMGMDNNVQNPSVDSNISNRLNALEQRVSRLENLVNNGTYSTNYNSSNYQMM